MFIWNVWFTVFYTAKISIVFKIKQSITFSKNVSVYILWCLYYFWDGNNAGKVEYLSKDYKFYNFLDKNTNIFAFSQVKNRKTLTAIYVKHKVKVSLFNPLQKIKLSPFPDW